MQEEVTLERTFGKTAGGYFQKVLTDHGVEVHGGEDVERFEGRRPRPARSSPRTATATPPTR